MGFFVVLPPLGPTMATKPGEAPRSSQFQAHIPPGPGLPFWTRLIYSRTMRNTLATIVAWLVGAAVLAYLSVFGGGVTSCPP